MPSERKIIAIVGMPGSGKSTARDFFEKKDWSVLRFGDQTDIGLKEQGLPLTEKNEKKYREEIRKELGMAAMAIKLKPRIDRALTGNNKIALDGLYSWEEYIFLKKYFKDLILLAVYARPDIRYLRLGKRKVRPLTLQEAQTRDIAEIEKLNKGGPIAIADYLVENNGSQNEFAENLKRFYEHIRI